MFCGRMGEKGRMRLIDADRLKNVIYSGGSETVDIRISKSMPLYEIVDTVIQAYRKCLFAELEYLPTAYDVDKVVERLEVNSMFAQVDDEPFVMLDDAIEIVRSGGIE